MTVNNGELVSRLRDPECDEWGRLFCRTKLAELAADEIERLQAERDELLAALRIARPYVQDRAWETVHGKMHIEALNKVDAVIAKAEGKS